MVRKLVLLACLLIAGCGDTVTTSPPPPHETYCWVSDPGGPWEADESCDLWGGYEFVRCEHHPEDCWYRESGLAAKA